MSEDELKTAVERFVRWRRDRQRRPPTRRRRPVPVDAAGYVDSYFDELELA